ncbi:MAG: nuclear transport factor 2 family protein [Novosphingobium sp.]
MPTLEERIARLEDRAEIRDLAARYFLATDDDNYGVLADCFTANADFEATGFEGGEGREGIIAFLQAARAGMGQTVHTIDYAHVTPTGPDTADGIVTAHLELGMDGTTVYAAVRYIDKYEREDGRWRIAARSMKTVHLGSWDLVASSLTEINNVRWPGGEPEPSDFPRKPS